MLKGGVFLGTYDKMELDAERKRRLTRGYECSDSQAEDDLSALLSRLQHQGRKSGHPLPFHGELDCGAEPIQLVHELIEFGVFV